MIKISIVVLISLVGLSFTRSIKDDLNDSIKRGEQVYSANCMSCHMFNGQGVPGIYPPLVNVGTLLEDVSENINIILKGQFGQTMVNGETYNTDMPAQDYLSDMEIADVLNFIRNSWGNSGKLILPDQVETERDSL